MALATVVEMHHYSKRFIERDRNICSFKQINGRISETVHDTTKVTIDD